jgi:chromosome segregation ATPase
MKRETVLSAVALVVAVVLATVLLVDLGGRSPRGRAGAEEPKPAPRRSHSDEEAQKAQEGARLTAAKLAEVMVQREGFATQLAEKQQRLLSEQEKVKELEGQLSTAKAQVEQLRVECESLSKFLTTVKEQEHTLRATVDQLNRVQRPAAETPPQPARSEDKLDRILDRLDKLEKRMSGLEETLKRKPQ